MCFLFRFCNRFVGVDCSGCALDGETFSLSSLVLLAVAFSEEWKLKSPAPFVSPRSEVLDHGNFDFRFAFFFSCVVRSLYGESNVSASASVLSADVVSP